MDIGFAKQEDPVPIVPSLKAVGMLTQVKTPREVFYAPQRLLVPLFQRPYVWSLERQWTPLWADVQRLAQRIADRQPTPPHFLGAVVLQQQPNEIGTLTIRTVIDGQQRLTTLQLLLDAVCEQVDLLGHGPIAQQVRDLVENPAHFCTSNEDRYKVWPTNRDRAAFNEVMSAAPPIAYSQLENSHSRMAHAHKYFADEARQWLEEADTEIRAHALTQAVSSAMQIVVIDLQADEDAQEIFETLNARGTPLTPADLIKNFVFQRLDATAGVAESSYQQYWQEFETPFWEKEVSSGRVIYSRSSLFLNQWLISKAIKDVPSREVFAQFKRFVTDADDPIVNLLPRIKRAADQYRRFTEASLDGNRLLDRLELFIYRTSTLESEVIKPLVLWLIDEELGEVPGEQIERGIGAIESWLVRRACVRGSTKAYNRFLVDLLEVLAAGPRDEAGTVIETFLKVQESPNTYWPGDAELRRVLNVSPIYRTMRRGRLRMILEAVEDHRRGWDLPQSMHEQRVVRNYCTIEHVMPQDWGRNWPAASQAEQEERSELIHTLGNLTLTTQALNSSVSNGPWIGANGKRDALKKNSSLMITHDVVEMGDPDWTPVLIRERTTKIIDDIIEIWPVPEGHTGSVAGSIELAQSRVVIADLVNAGMLSPGQVIYSRTRAHFGVPCEIGADGRLFVGGKEFETPSAAAKAVTGSQSEAGWWFWIIDHDATKSLSDLRAEYLDGLDADESDDDELPVA